MSFNNLQFETTYFSHMSNSHSCISRIISLLQQQETGFQNMINLHLERNRRTSNRIRNNSRWLFNPLPTTPSIFQASQNNNRNTTNIHNLADAFSLFTNPSNQPPVRQMPTQEQIESAIEEISFNSIENPINTSCPINREPFSSTDTVIRIRQCGHIFMPSAIRRWFETSTRCPCCRINILSDLETNTTNTANITNAANTANITNAANTTNITNAANTTNITNATSTAPTMNNIPSQRRVISTNTASRTDFINELSALLTNDIFDQLSNTHDLSDNVTIEYMFGSNAPTVTSNSSLDNSSNISEQNLDSSSNIIHDAV